MEISNRRWTVLIVPHGSADSRTYEVTEALVRRVVKVAAGVCAGVLATAGAAGWLLGHWHATPNGHQLEAEVSALRDTIAVIAKRDSQIRLLAGLPAVDSQLAVGPVRPLDVDGLITQANTLSASFAKVSTTLEQNSARMARTPSIMPTAGWLSSEFSKARFHPILHVERPHEGIDIAAPYGAPVVAPAAGDVMRVTWQTGYGLVLEIDHGNGIQTKYAHLSRVVVHPGQHVVRGDSIAAVGNSGLSTGPHLHYEIHVNGQVVDPLKYVLPGAIPD